MLNAADVLSAGILTEPLGAVEADAAFAVPLAVV